MTDVALWKVLAVLGVSILVGSSGAYTTYSAFSDSETTSVGVSAANDFTADAGEVEVKPETVSVERDGTFTIWVNVSDTEAVETSRFTVEIIGREGSVSARSAGTSCERVCKVKFSTAEFRRLAGGAGTYEIKLRGWWTHDRDFVATGTIVLAMPDSEPNSTDASGNIGDSASGTTVNGTNSPA